MNKQNERIRQARRRLLKGLGTGGALLAGSLPERWVHPAVNAVVLPAHAVLTGCTGVFCIYAHPEYEFLVQVFTGGTISVTGGAPYGGSGQPDAGGNFNIPLDNGAAPYLRGRINSSCGLENVQICQDLAGNSCLTPSLVDNAPCV